MQRSLRMPGAEINAAMLRMRRPSPADCVGTLSPLGGERESRDLLPAGGGRESSALLPAGGEKVGPQDPDEGRG